MRTFQKAVQEVNADWMPRKEASFFARLFFMGKVTLEQVLRAYDMRARTMAIFRNLIQTRTELVQ